MITKKEKQNRTGDPVNDGCQVNPAKYGIKVMCPERVMKFERHAGQYQGDNRQCQYEMLNSLVYRKPEKIFFPVFYFNDAFFFQCANPPLLFLSGKQSSGQIQKHNAHQRQQRSAGQHNKKEREIILRRVLVTVKFWMNRISCQF